MKNLGKIILMNYVILFLKEWGYLVVIIKYYGYIGEEIEL